MNGYIDFQKPNKRDGSLMDGIQLSQVRMTMAEQLARKEKTGRDYNGVDDGGKAEGHQRHITNSILI